MLQEAYDNAAIKKRMFTSGIDVSVMAVRVSVTIGAAGDVEYLVHCEFIAEGRTVNKERHIEFFVRLRDALRRKYTEEWARNSLFLLHCSTPAHRSFVVKESTLPRTICLPFSILHIPRACHRPIPFCFLD
jgi:hypothetical protein